MTSLKVLLNKETKNAEKSDFQLYWEKIERAEKAYAASERKRAKIVDRFNQEILPFEQTLTQVHFQFIQQLLGHLAKKSLSNADKDELVSWILRECEDLSSSPFRSGLDLNAVMDQVHQYEIARVKRNPAADHELKMDIKNQVLHLFYAQGLDPEHANMDEFVAAFEKSPEEFFKLFMKYAEEHHQEEDKFETEFDESDFVKDGFQSKENFESESPVDESHPEAMNTQQLSILFKRLAQKLHPDRATTDADRELKHDLMLQLNKARKENDVYTLLQLVRDFGDTVDAKLSEGQLAHLAGHLEAKLVELQMKKRQLKTDSNIDAMIYDKFHAPSNAKIDQKFTLHRYFLEKSIAEFEQCIEDTSSLKKCKHVLADRSPVFPWEMFDI